MSKIKEEILRSQEQQMIYMSKFFDYLYDSVIKMDLTSNELDEMQRDNSKHSDIAVGTLPNKSFKVANNKNYIPIIGA